MPNFTLVHFGRFAQISSFLSVIATVAFWAPTAQSQILFDINNAAVSGNDVTQTVLFGGANFELTASYTSGGGAALFPLGGGDFVFFSNGPVPDPAQFRLSLTRDGVATNFTLNQVDFASFAGVGSGISFDILNDNGDLITDDFVIPDNTGIPPTGSFSIDNTANATDVQFVDFVGSGVGSTLFTDFNNIIVTPTAVPEPSSLVGLGLFSIGVLTRRKRR